MKVSHWISRAKRQARKLKRRAGALIMALRNQATPWYAKVCAVVVIAYAASPIDLIPDFIPVLGYVDDLILVPLGIMLTIRLIPRPVLLTSLRLAWNRDKVESGVMGRMGAAGILIVWILFALVVLKRVFFLILHGE